MFISDSSPGPSHIINGKDYLYFAGTSYLCMHSHPELVQAAKAAIEQYGTGIATSRSGFGTTQLLLDLESAAADYFGSETAYYFPSGYLGAAILIKTVCGNVDTLLLDEFSHHCISEAAFQQGKKVKFFSHLSSEHVSELARECQKNNESFAIATDGVFSITGDVAPLNDYVQIAKETESNILVDDAHATAVLGNDGKGTAEYCSIKYPYLYITTTASKALGGYGGIIPCSRELKEQIQNKSGVYDGSTPLPAAVMATTRKALTLKSVLNERREKLAQNCVYFKKKLQSTGIATSNVNTPIINLALESSKKMRTIQGCLMDSGIAVAFIKSYSGIKEQGTIRIAIFSEHTRPMLDTLLDHLTNLLV